MDRIKNLSLDQKAKLYYMGLVRKGEIDTLPEDPKAAFVKDMMGRKDELKGIATELGYLNEKESYQNLPYTYEVLLDDLDFETLKSSFPEYYQNEKFIRPQTGEPYYSDNISFPNLDDSMSQIGDPEALKDWKDKVRRQFGDVIIKFNNKAKNWFDKVFVDDFEFNFAKEKFIRGKKSAMKRDQELGRSKQLKENITKLDNYALEIYSDFRKDPSIHFPDVEFEVDEEGFALENDSNYSQLKKYKREIMGLHALFGEESGVKDKNGLQLSMYDVIDNI